MSKTKKKEYHRLANMFPMLPEYEAKLLVESIEKHGLKEPIVLYQGQILDGRNRYEACLLAIPPVEPRFVESECSTDEEARDDVIIRNLRRRQAAKGQRAAMAYFAREEYEHLRPRRGRPNSKPSDQSEILGNFVDNLGEVFGVSGDIVGFAFDIAAVKPNGESRLENVFDGTEELMAVYRELVKKETEESFYPKEARSVLASYGNILGKFNEEWTGEDWFGAWYEEAHDKHVQAASLFRKFKP